MAKTAENAAAATRSRSLRRSPSECKSSAAEREGSRAKTQGHPRRRSSRTIFPRPGHKQRAPALQRSGTGVREWKNRAGKASRDALASGLSSTQVWAAAGLQMSL